MEQLDYNLLFRWFVGLGGDDAVRVPAVFSKNRDRLLDADIAKTFLSQLLALSEVRMSDEHFSVDGTLVEAWASMTRFLPKSSQADATASPPSDDVAAKSPPDDDLSLPPQTPTTPPPTS
jgi:Transposase domain (DUF772)